LCDPHYQLKKVLLLVDSNYDDTADCWAEFATRVFITFINVEFCLA
jgi:hypothetical protein